jgi:hypothetical protein
VAIAQLLRTMTYEVPPQDLNINLARISAIPQSRLIISNVKRIGPPAES